jgi:hypothetical protein
LNNVQIIWQPTVQTDGDSKVIAWLVWYEADAGVTLIGAAVSVVAACAAGTTSNTTTAATPRSLATISSSFRRAYDGRARKARKLSALSSGLVGRPHLRRGHREPLASRRPPHLLDHLVRARHARPDPLVERAQLVAQSRNLGVVARVSRAAERVLQLRALLREPVGLEAQAGDLAARPRPGANRRAREAGERARVVDAAAVTRSKAVARLRRACSAQINASSAAPTSRSTPTRT